MPTFILKKYSDKLPENKPQVDDVKETVEKEETKPDVIGTLKLTASTSIAEMIAIALNKTLKTTELVEVSDDDIAESGNSINSMGQVISTEVINSDPVGALKSIQPGVPLCIINNGFKTKEEEFFLTNVENKTDKVFYTVESFATFFTMLFGGAGPNDYKSPYMTRPEENNYD